MTDQELAKLKQMIRCGLSRWECVALAYEEGWLTAEFENEIQYRYPGIKAQIKCEIAKKVVDDSSLEAAKFWLTHQGGWHPPDRVEINLKLPQDSPNEVLMEKLGSMVDKYRLEKAKGVISHPRALQEGSKSDGQILSQSAEIYRTEDQEAHGRRQRQESSHWPGNGDGQAKRTKGT